MPRTPWRPLVSTSLLVLAVLVTRDTGSGAQRLPWPNAGEDPIVTPVAGPSWLSRLGIPLRRTNLGQGSGRYGPGPAGKREPPTESLAVPPTVVVTGQDLYRLSCQACHREEGTGRPPEIASLLDPILGSSLELVQDRLRRQQSPTPDETARSEANQARAAVLERMHEGGKRMPPRDYLRAQDMRVLFGYLTRLAGAPDSESETSLRVSWARLGELAVKGTCHICHDAMGPRPSRPAMLAGAIPSLASLLNDKSIGEFVHKARAGEVVSLTEIGVDHRGRMPVFHYLQDREVAAAYMYLATYPPQPAGR